MTSFAGSGGMCADELMAQLAEDQEFQKAAAEREVAATTRLLGPYLANVYDGSPSRADKVFGPVERVIYRLCGIDEEREQRWNVYAVSVLAHSLVSVQGTRVALSSWRLGSSS